ncbi:hypothetical protein N5J48_07285 [Acinetobacter ursingii]|uniref:Uncharacterized protein n=1 Tax=Acinetobacter ursingii TaxID=108980 RepID=A0AA46S361_9GAMM|nr:MULTISPECIES: hypothetical protein [Acinetobacter]ENV74917.1 hypothetical protein F944_02783 [Acinetobacter ursingii DSM 16037 = CIP 107286]MCU4350600.1 hypothetical protein [Acinetobacter ursingii]MCU4358746.1 hypothetical protein [Acinetobacter ursingii]MCU4487980.1 hypothetical protein [Acinetobacter ursingii]MCU4497131.1 hypothetical protein [Acinetobacter ursingii]
MNSRVTRRKLLEVSKQMTRHFIIICGLLLWMPLLYAANPQSHAIWYRYYDQKGIANISSSVTPAHIRYGYEALDSNMQVIRRNRPYNAEADLRQSTQREAQARQREQDLKLKRAYGNVAIATEKQNQALSGIKKQIQSQQDQLRQLQSDRILFKRQEMEYLRKGESSIPQRLKDQLNQNDQNMTSLKKNISSLQNNYRTTQEHYSNIIERLKTLE